MLLPWIVIVATVLMVAGAFLFGPSTSWMLAFLTAVAAAMLLAFVIDLPHFRRRGPQRG
jgi:hypothetical protein